MHAAREALTRAGTVRVGRCIGLAALALLLGSKGLQNAVAEGDTRTISLHHIHTGEDLTITYKREGRYDEDALKKLNHLLRDWRKDEETRMDPRLLDVVWEVYRDVDAKGPIQVVCGYRSPATNAMLRKRSRGVAQFSQHMLGRAMDFFIPGVPLETQREAGLRLQRGGVGYYPSSGSPFVHLDVGNVRHWPRMTREQLARVFPNGRTVHVPSDGRPLPGYALALADIEKRGSSEPSRTSLDAARSAGITARPQRNVLAALLGAKDEDDDGETAAAAPKADQPADKPAEKASEKTPAKTAVKIADARPAAPAKTPPRVAAKNAASFNLASAESEPVRLAGPASAAAPAARIDLIADRGYWQTPAPPAQPHASEAKSEPAQIAAAPARPASAASLRARAEQRTAPTGPTETTGAVARWPVRIADAADRVPSDVALAYAAQANVAPAAPVTRSLSPVADIAIPRSASNIPPAPPIETAQQDPPPARIAPVAAAPALKPGMAPQDPWLRALVLAPNLQNYMTATAIGQPDMRELRALMDKPDSVVAMTFGDDPQAGLTTDRFSGSAVVFVSTQGFEKRTTGLQ
jgi:uncharacterized protein YcbK (DUF882 family)